MWIEKLNEGLTREGFSRSKADPCLYSRNQEDRWKYILIYVDDIITRFEQEGDCNPIVHKLKENFEIKKLGNISCYLGIKIEKEKHGRSSQTISKILEQFHMQDAKEVKTPMEPGYQKSNESENLLPNNDMYRRAISKLLYVATLTRPSCSSGHTIQERISSLSA